MVDPRADDTDHACSCCRTCPDIRLTGNVVEMDPLTVIALYDALRAEHLPHLADILESFQGALDPLLRKLMSCLYAEIIEYLVRVVTAVMVMMVVVMMSLMVVILVVMVMVVVVVILMVMFFMVMVMIMMMFMLLRLFCLMLRLLPVSFLSQLIQFCRQCLFLFHDR